MHARSEHRAHAAAHAACRTVARQPSRVCRTSSGYGPTNIEKSPQYVARLIKLVNLMSTRSNIQFFVQEVRYQPDK